MNGHNNNKINNKSPKKKKKTDLSACCINPIYVHNTITILYTYAHILKPSHINSGGQNKSSKIKVVNIMVTAVY